MRIYLSVDMEGISGVTRWADVVADGQDYQRARSWLTRDVNAAIAGARAAGASDVVVEENHGTELLTNVVLDEIDPDVEVVRGAPRSGQITTAIALDDSFDAMFLIGHHAKVGDHGVCAHTISYGSYADVRLDGRTVSEGEIFAQIAAQHGVPTALLSGDDVVAAELAKLCPGLTTAVVKHALGRESARIIPPVRAHRIIEEAATEAVRRVRAGQVDCPPTRAIYEFEIEMRSPISDDARAWIAERFAEMRIVDDHTVAFAHEEMSVAYRMAAATQFIVTMPGQARHY